MGLNTAQGITGSANSYGTGNNGFKASVTQVRKYDKVLLKMLDSGKPGNYQKHLMHKKQPKRLGDVINLRRYFNLEADPDKLKLDKQTITGPELKELRGAAVELKLEWFGNGIELNDYLNTVHIDDLMAIYMPVLYDNAKAVKENIALKAIYSGASKAFVKTYTPATGAVELGAAVGDVAAPLNHTILRAISLQMLNNTESYSVTEGGKAVTLKIPAKIKPASEGGRYKVLVSANGMEDLLDDAQFLDKFVKGISAQELRDNKIVNLYRYSIEEVGHHLTIKSTSGDLDVNWGGDLEVAFMFGKDFGADIQMEGEALKVFHKTDNTADSGDKYGRLNFITYKMAYQAKVINSVAIYAIVFKPSASKVTGTFVAPSPVAPIV